MKSLIFSIFILFVFIALSEAITVLVCDCTQGTPSFVYDSKASTATTIEGNKPQRFIFIPASWSRLTDKHEEAKNLAKIQNLIAKDKGIQAIAVFCDEDDPNIKAEMDSMVSKISSVKPAQIEKFGLGDDLRGLFDAAPAGLENSILGLAQQRERELAAEARSTRR